MCEAPLGTRPSIPSDIDPLQGLFESIYDYLASSRSHCRHDVGARSSSIGNRRTFGLRRQCSILVSLSSTSEPCQCEISTEMNEICFKAQNCNWNLRPTSSKIITADTGGAHTRENEVSNAKLIGPRNNSLEGIEYGVTGHQSPSIRWRTGMQQFRRKTDSASSKQIAMSLCLVSS
jgi:hypothetical protein